jgi:SsrA-binding protein
MSGPNRKGRRPMKTVATNKPAFFNYDIIETFEAGITLQGSEVKSIRDGRISLKESYGEVRNGEVFLVNCNISPYEAANIFNHEPKRMRKLLLHHQEIKRLTGKIREKGLTLVPTKVLFNDKGLVKVEIALAKGKKTYQKKEAIKERDRDRELRAEMKHRLR